MATVFLLGAMCAVPVCAFERQDKLLLAESSVLSQDEAAAQARSRTGGRVLRIRPSQENGRPVYQVKLLLSDGRVRIVTIDAASGELAE